MKRNYIVEGLMAIIIMFAMAVTIMAIEYINIPPADTVVTTISTTEEPTEPIPEVTDAPVPTEPETTVEVTEPPTEPHTEAPTEAPTTAVEPDDTWVYLGKFKCTAYCSCEKCCGKWAINRPVDENGNEIVITSSGAVAEVGVTIATDISVIPFGSQVLVNGHVYTAQDEGGSIIGNTIDIYFESHEAAWDWGVQYHDLWVKKG